MIDESIVDSYRMAEILGLSLNVALKKSREDTNFPARQKKEGCTKFYWAKAEVGAYAKCVLKNKRGPGRECVKSTLNNALAQVFIRCAGKYWLLAEKLAAVGL